MRMIQFEETEVFSRLESSLRYKRFYRISQNKSLNQEEGKIRETAHSLSGAIRDPGHVQNTI